MNKIATLTFGMLISMAAKTFSQGCSDAGFCTIGSLAPSATNDSAFKHLAKLAFSYGIGEQSTTHVHVIPELEFSFFKNNTLQIKVPYISVNGNLGSNSGIGDAVLSISQKIISKKNANLTVTVGTKLPTGTTDKSADNIPLPMPYQTGLGTTDLILGISYQYKKWKLSSGYQKVLSNKNENRFLHSASNSIDANKYFESNLLERGDDALIRIERNFAIHKIKLSVGLLGIYRLQQDKITDSSGKQFALKGSDGLTLNITGGVQYDFTKHSGVSFLFGRPMVVRSTRADGLTRKLVVTVAYLVRFGK